MNIAGGFKMKRPISKLTKDHRKHGYNNYKTTVEESKQEQPLNTDLESNQGDKKEVHSMVLIISHMFLGYISDPNYTSVRSVIEEICNKDNKYVKQYEKEDYIAKNDFIFNLKKTHKLKLDKNTAQLYANEADDLMLK